MTTSTPNPSPAVGPPAAAGEARTQHRIRYWLTPGGCAATVAGHRPDLDGRHCRVCGVRLGGA